MKLNLGCGAERFHLSGWINVDVRQECRPDVVHDVTRTPWFVGSNWRLPSADSFVTTCRLPDDSVSRIRADNLLEHIPLPIGPMEDKLRDVLNEAHRVMTSDGVFWIRVPDVEEWPRGAFRDPTHSRFWCEGSFDYWSIESGTWKEYGSVYGYLPWRVSVTKERAQNVVFLVAEMSPVKG